MYLYLILPAAVALLLVYYIHSIQSSTRNMPPGPFNLPIIGSIFSIYLRKPTIWVFKVRAWDYITMLTKLYGDIFTVSFLKWDAVVISSYELLTEVSNMDEYSHKFANEHITYGRTFGKELGLLFVSKPHVWTEMRKFSVRTLRDFGFGKLYTMHSVIIEEVNVLIRQFKKEIKSDAGVIRFRNTFSLSVLNVLWCMVAGIRYEHDDVRLLKLMDRVFKLSKNVHFGNPFEALIPYTKSFAPRFFNSNMRDKTFDECHQLSRQLLEERRAQGTFLTEPENYIDVFLKKIHENKNDKDTVYTDHQLQSMIVDLLFVGSLTLNATLNYAVLFLTLHPEIQKKIQDELDSTVSMHMNPTIDDVAKMPFFQAFMLEVHRCGNVVPIPIPRTTPKEWLLRGYRIPKGTVIFTSHYSINMDEKIWGDPFVFRPSRFINSKGEFVPDPRVTAFGFGKRICIGIHLVNSVIPLFLAMLLKHYSFSIVPGTKPPTTEPEIGISLSPEEFPSYLTPRKYPSNIPA